VPTAEREPAVGVSIFRPMLNGVRGLVYLTPEERDLVGGATGNRSVRRSSRGAGRRFPRG